MGFNDPLKYSYAKTFNQGLVALFALYCIFIIQGADSSKDVFKAEIPSDATQRIAIVIGAEKDVASSRALVGINADDQSGGGGSDSGSGNGNGSFTGRGRLGTASTTWERCQGGSSGSNTKCCYQYTWIGYRSELPPSENATCDYLVADKKDLTLSCFDPIVYTVAREADGSILGTPPDFEQLRDDSRAQNWGIYCPKTEKSCVTLTHYSRTGDKAVTNQTRFCGVVTNSNTGDRLTSGCYRQNVRGFVREVCTCDGNLCNGKSVLQLSTGLAFLTSSLLILAKFPFIASSILY